jgi:hypothetical protein
MEVKFDGGTIYIADSDILEGKQAEIYEDEEVACEVMCSGAEDYLVEVGENISKGQPCVISESDGKLYVLDETDAVPTLDGELDTSVELNFHSMDEIPLASKYQIPVVMLVQTVNEISLREGYFQSGRLVLVYGATEKNNLLGWAYAPEQKDLIAISNQLKT